MRQTNAAILLLSKHYRAILKHAFLASIVASSAAFADNTPTNQNINWQSDKEYTSGIYTITGSSESATTISGSMLFNTDDVKNPTQLTITGGSFKPESESYSKRPILLIGANSFLTIKDTNLDLGDGFIHLDQAKRLTLGENAKTTTISAKSLNFDFNSDNSPNVYIYGTTNLNLKDNLYFGTAGNITIYADANLKANAGNLFLGERTLLRNSGASSFTATNNASFIKSVIENNKDLTINANNTILNSVDLNNAKNANLTINSNISSSGSGIFTNYGHVALKGSLIDLTGFTELKNYSDITLGDNTKLTINGDYDTLFGTSANKGTISFGGKGTIEIKSSDFVHLQDQILNSDGKINTSNIKSFANGSLLVGNANTSNFSIENGTLTATNLTADNDSFTLGASSILNLDGAIKGTLKNLTINGVFNINGKNEVDLNNSNINASGDGSQLNFNNSANNINEITTNGSAVSIKDNQYIKANNISVTSGSLSTNDRVSITSKGKIDLIDTTASFGTNNVISATSLSSSGTGSFNLGEGSKLLLSGDLTIGGSNNNSLNKSSISAANMTVNQNTDIESSNINLGKGKLEQTAGSLSLKNNSQLDAGTVNFGSSTITDSSIHANDITFNGEAQTNNAYIKANNLTNNFSNSLQAGSTIETSSFTNKGTYKVNYSTIIAKNFINSGKFNLDGSTLHADNITSSGDMNVIGNSTFTSNSINLINEGSDIFISSSNVTTNQLNLASHTSISVNGSLDKLGTVTIIGKNADKDISINDADSFKINKNGKVVIEGSALDLKDGKLFRIDANGGFMVDTGGQLVLNFGSDVTLSINQIQELQKELGTINGTLGLGDAQIGGIEQGGKLSLDDIKKLGVSSNLGVFEHTVVDGLTSDQAKDTVLSGKFASINLAKGNEKLSLSNKDLYLSQSQYNNDFYVKDSDGNAGNVELTGGKLTLENGGSIGNVSGSGNLVVTGGTTNASDVTIDNVHVDSNTTLNANNINSSSQVIVDGNATIDNSVKAAALTINGQLSSSSINATNITIAENANVKSDNLTADDAININGTLETKQIDADVFGITVGQNGYLKSDTITSSTINVDGKIDAKTINMYNALFLGTGSITADSINVTSGSVSFFDGAHVKTKDLSLGDAGQLEGKGTLEVSNKFTNENSLTLNEISLKLSEADLNEVTITNGAKLNADSVSLKGALTLGEAPRGRASTSDAINVFNVKELKEQASPINVYSGILAINPKGKDVNDYISDLNNNNATAALVLADNKYTFSDTTNKINIGANGTSGDYALNMGAQSLTILDNASLTDTKVNLDNSAKLLVKNVSAGYTILSNITFNGIDDIKDLKGWQNDNLIFANKFLNLKYDEKTNSFVTVTDLSNNAYNLLSEQERAYLMQITTNSAKLSANGDVFVNRILNEVAADDTQALGAQKRLSSLSNIAYLSGIYSIANTIADNQDRAISNLDKKGLAVFAVPLYNSNSYDDLPMSNLSYGLDVDLTGLAIGFNRSFSFADASFYTTFGKGKSSSNGDSVATDNDYSFISIGVAANKEIGNFNLVSNLAYTTISSDVEQSNLDKLTASFDSDLIFLQLGAQYNYSLSDNATLKPYVMANVKYINVDGYDVSNAAKVMSVGASDATLFELPIGAKLECAHVNGDLTVVPSLDVAIIPTFGDKDTNVDIAYNSTLDNSSMSMQSDISSSIKYKIGAAVNGYYHNNQFGVGVNYLGSSDQKDLGLFAKYQYNF